MTFSQEMDWVYSFNSGAHGGPRLRNLHGVRTINEKVTGKSQKYPNTITITITLTQSLTLVKIHKTHSNKPRTKHRTERARFKRPLHTTSAQEHRAVY